MDMDSIGAMVLARYLFPDHRLVRSRFIHPVARNLFNLYQYHLDCLTASELQYQNIEKIVVVDTRSYNQVREYFTYIPDFSGEIEVFDHHGAVSSDLPRAVIHDGKCGAATTMLGIEHIRRGIFVSPEDATIALTGIFADTGNFTHENVTDADFQAASFLVRSHASIRLVNTFLKPFQGEHQLTLFYDLLEHLEDKNINGHFIIMGLFEMERQASGLSEVVDKVFEIETPDALFAVFWFKKENQTLIVGRSRKETVKVNRILEYFGGGGHPCAASALVKNQEGRPVYEHLRGHLHVTLLPAAVAGEIMSRRIACIDERWSLKEAAIFLERVDHTGAPVINASGRLVGIVTLRDIMKGRKAEQMHAPVKGYMKRQVITAAKNTTVREIEQLLFRNDIGHLPIVDDEKMVGMITRSDYLSFVRGYEPTLVDSGTP